MAKNASFHWDDPFLLDAQLSADERSVRDAAASYCQERLAPRVLEAFRHERTDVEIFREMGALGLLGPTISEAYGGAGLNYVCYGLVAQVRQALQNAVDVLNEAGAKPEHIVRMNWYLLDRREYLLRGKEIGNVFRELIGSFNAAMTAVQVTALIEARAKVEIEVTAVIPDR